MVYGGFWLTIGVIFIVMFTAGVVKSGPAFFASRWRLEGVWVAPGTDSNRKTSDPESRRDVPLGTTEPQCNV